jgi:hypothetical protein
MITSCPQKAEAQFNLPSALVFIAQASAPVVVFHGG